MTVSHASRPSPNRLLSALAALVVAAAVIIGVPQTAAAADDAAPAHLRVVWTSDPAREATISWTTRFPGSDHAVYLDTEPRGGDPAAYRWQLGSAANGAYTYGEAIYHHVPLAGLAPSTTYYFVVASNGHVSRELHFTTAPVDDRPFKLLYGGDSRSDPENRRRVNRRIAALVEADPTILALVHGGDFVAQEASWSQWDQWLADHAETITADGRILPIVPTIGNHEGGGVFFNEVFAWPGGAERDYYALRFGSDLTLINLDTNAPMNGVQRDWLRDQLADAQQRRWVVVNYHRPAYPAVKTPSEARSMWVPLFEEYGVDLVCESDGHALKRTVPILDDQPDPNGIVYVGEGGMGVRQRTPDADRWYLQAPGMAMSAHHVQRLSFGPERLDYEAVLLDGGVADAASFDPRRELAATDGAGLGGADEPAGPYVRTLDAAAMWQPEVGFGSACAATGGWHRSASGLGFLAALVGGAVVLRRRRRMANR